MKHLLNNKHHIICDQLLQKHCSEKIAAYMQKIKQIILKCSTEICDKLNHLADLLDRTKINKNEVFLFEAGHDYHVVSHANIDFLKNNGIRTVNISIPELTALGNDLPFPDQLKEMVKLRRFGEGDILLGIQCDKCSELLVEAFKYNASKNGINVLITNNNVFFGNVDIRIDIPYDNDYITGDLVQILLHFISAHLKYKYNGYNDTGAKNFISYSKIIANTLEYQFLSIHKLTEITFVLINKLKQGYSIFAFGNGGSSAIAAYFVNQLKREIASSLSVFPGTIIDVSNNICSISKTIKYNNFKNNVFSNIILDNKFKDGDVILGVSSSGNSENIVHTFKQFPTAFKIGILGFQDGGIVNKLNITNLHTTIPDVDNFKSYQRAEDCQRIVLSSILYALNN